ncbi:MULTISPECIES: thermonuclease family protein [unclassified Chelatococcus]|uniref:thermonuclease family protein n=1 Tax=unclassified Chelatococcus TaxID=2638111 RepID=UPI001BCB8D97|nr:MULTISPECIES: thermonuclease family protein [unclassified Chelatococcus]MBS7697827.1 thermonuclease family protein [Chelatococcus sp. YT9]MBX3559818.1 thermonuclease family protein [Chelatococcus sp.]
MVRINKHLRSGFRAAVLALVLATPAVAQERILVLDGDTIAVGRERIRIVGIDAPETFDAHCPAEKALGDKATAALRQMVAHGVRVERAGTKDRYRRTLARVFYRGHDVADIMVERGLAVRYDCPRGRCPRRIDWCERLGG